MKRRTWAVAPPLLALAVGACSPDAAAGPAAVATVEAIHPLAVRGEAAEAMQTTVDDALTRVLPTFDDQGAASRIGQTLMEVDAAFLADDGVALAAALENARQSLATERASLQDTGAVAELDALALLLDTVEEAVPPSHRRGAIAEAP